MSTPISDAGHIPVNNPSPIIRYSPVVLNVPGRAVPLEARVSAPETGSGLPVILLSHGHGRSVFLSSMLGYGPLADFWAAHGFAVIQPTHLDSGMLGLREADDPGAPLYARSRAADMRHILDHLDQFEEAVPGLAGRLDRSRIAVAGHSLGGHTACVLLGMRFADPDGGTSVDLKDERVTAGVVLAAPGNGDLSAFASENYPVLRHTDFSAMTGQALVVAGDKDLNPMFSGRLSFRWDAYTQSPGPKVLLTLFGAEHSLGGVAGYDAAETTDENPGRVATLRAMAWAYLRSTLYPGDPAWDDAVAALKGSADPLGKVESK
jgi:dienelactone hydrolase